jgi:hypothetical protein
MSISNTAATTGNLIKNTQDLEFRRHDVDFPSCGATLRDDARVLTKRRRISDLEIARQSIALVVF